MNFQLLKPLNIKKLFAIAPTMNHIIYIFNQIEMTLIFVEIFDPPIMQVIGPFLF